MRKLINPDPELDLWYRSDTCVVYLLHAARPVHGAQHYLGSTEDMERRMAEHKRVWPLYRIDKELNIMIITHVSVTVGMTHNLGDYSNFRPEVQLSAQIGPEENASHCVNRLLNEGRDLCYEQVDRVLEDNKKPAYYSTDVRYTAYTCRDEQIVVLVSDFDMMRNDALQDRLEHYQTSRYAGHRQDALYDIIRRQYPNWRVIVANAAFINDIPVIDSLFNIQIGTTHIIGKIVDYDSLPDFLRNMNVKRSKRNLESLCRTLDESCTIAIWTNDSDSQRDILLLPDILDAKTAWDAKTQEPPSEPPDQDDDDYDDYDDYDEE